MYDTCDVAFIRIYNPSESRTAIKFGSSQLFLFSFVFLCFPFFLLYTETGVFELYTALFKY
jgi:hypothetical protein